MNITFSLIKSSQSKHLLNVNNFLFMCSRSYLNSENIKIFYWNCSSYTQTKCPAGAQIDERHQILKISESKTQSFEFSKLN